LAGNVTFSRGFSHIFESYRGRSGSLFNNTPGRAGRDPLVMGASYVGHMDDLAVFNRALTVDEIKQLYGLKQGVSELR
jgi:hypothetical protein